MNQPPAAPSSGRPWWRRWHVILAAAPTTIAMVKVPRLVGLTLPSARAALAERGLRERTTAPPPPSTAPAQDCGPSYPDVCLDPSAEDYDCAGGSGNGPEHVEGPTPGQTSARPEFR